MLLLFLVTIMYGCSGDTERENPLDAQNQRTGGIPLDVTAKAGDGQVKLSWPNLGFEGVKEFKIYRAYLSPEPDNFQYVATVTADNSGSYTYTDKGLLNDGENVYFYRVSYVDSNGQETPDPKEPNKILPKDWSILHLIPSLAPPMPNVKVMEDTDLQVRLLWEGYSKTAPADLAGFKVYEAPKADKGQEQQPLTLVLTIDDPKVEFYIDGNDYVNNTVSFRKDGVSKLYKVTAYDKAGVESDSPILTGTSPNLPPTPPAQIKGLFSLGLNNYEIRLDWRRNLEPDAIGYKVYAMLPDGSREFKGWKTDPNDTVMIITDNYVAVEGDLFTKSYYVTAYDNTKKPDPNNPGQELNDESAPSQIIGLQ
jgi:hypothetical protein